ncbi:MAG: hypothetical protein PHS67_00310 [Sphaerochaetaceae bacterium]|jgi:hypothetical protein|nr:hypothetical protein [Sphaerochaetaceae bacterium]MDD4218864.1 hypothetical protein [Sphaerochaetaceae bacterium]
MFQIVKILKPLLLILVVVTLSSCMTYNYAEAKSVIYPTPSIAKTPLVPTKFSELQKEPKIEVASAPVPTQAILPPKQAPLSTFSAALIPLPQNAPSALLDCIVTEVHSADVDIFGFTGEEDIVSYLEDQLEIPTFRIDERRLLATKLEASPHTDHLFLVQIDLAHTIKVGILDLFPSNPFQSFFEAPAPQWQTILSNVDQELPIPTDESPILLLASLGQPTSEDWFETATNHPYRIFLRWPYSDLFKERGFFDSWRLTHYNAEAAPGTTWEFTTGEGDTYAERIDYIYTQGLLPLASETITIGPWDNENLPYEERSAVMGTFVVP